MADTDEATPAPAAPIARPWTTEQMLAEDVTKRMIVDFLQQHGSTAFQEERKVAGDPASIAKNRKKDVLISAYDALFETNSFKGNEPEGAADEDGEGEDDGEDDGAEDLAARLAAISVLNVTEEEKTRRREAVKKSGPVISRGRDGGKKKPLKMKKAAEKLELDEDLEFKQRQKEEAARVRAAQAELMKKKGGKK
eukprot:GILI01022731.1.p1 GENE.GILI01022731.1~~GILI01022731.1.p1  ORF type:complete len:209 (-),score=74.56 GILI01022731.1:120-704(-)